MASPERDKEQSPRGAEHFHKDNVHATQQQQQQQRGGAGWAERPPAPSPGPGMLPLRAGELGQNREETGRSFTFLSFCFLIPKQTKTIKKSLILPFCSIFCGNRLQALQGTTNFNYSQHLSDAFSVIQKCKATVLTYKCLDFICNSHIQVSSEARGLSVSFEMKCLLSHAR